MERLVWPDSFNLRPKAILANNNAPPDRILPLQPLTFHGHVLRAGDSTIDTRLPSGGGSDDGDGTDVLVRRTVAGTFLAGAPASQCFARTEEVLQTGMCGGPVLNAAGRCVGIVEGVVQPPPAATSSTAAASHDGDIRARAARFLQDAAVFIGAAEIAALLRVAERVRPP